MRVLVTRPAEQAAPWLQRLRAHGHEALALPLIAIAPLDDESPLHAAWRALPSRALAMFVSANAVGRFFAAAPPSATGGSAWPPATLAAAPGPGTVEALRRHGVPPACLVAPRADATQFDSEALWQVLAPRLDWRGREVLLVQGADGGRDWLAERLAEAGASVDRLATYRRLPPMLDAAEQATLRAALAAPREHLWWFTSAQAIDHLEALVAGLGAHWHEARALATHPRIAERARRLGIGHVATCSPEPAAVLEALAAEGRSIQFAPPPG